MRAFPPQTRIDAVANGLSQEARREIAFQSVSAVFDVFLAGYAHRDFHVQNLYWVDGQVKLSDFELMGSYEEGKRPPFPLSYDITGQGLNSPFLTSNNGYASSSNPEYNLQQVLKVPIEQVLSLLVEQFRVELEEQSSTFHKKTGRHICKKEKLIYGSFKLPYMDVPASRAQRDSDLRLKNFGVDESVFAGKTVLDLGCHTGSMLFQIQNFHPSRCVGFEYDSGKIAVARKIAAYNGLNNIQFLQGNIDKLSGEDFNGPFEVVICLAIDAHVQKPRKLHNLLGSVCSGVLLFESNSTADPADIQASLSSSGFAEIKMLGISTDDVVAENNQRRMFLARKQVCK